MSKGRFEMSPGKKHLKYALSRCVMAVASYDEEVGDWAAYVDAIPGHDHDEEWKAILDHGMKLPKRIAEVIFPTLAEDEKLKWRD